MPQASIVAVLGVSAATAAIIQAILINVALGYLSKKLAQRKDGFVPPINVTIRGSVEPRRYLLGTRRTGGVLVFYGTSNTGGALKDLLWYVIVLATHQVSDITDIWLDSERIADADINSGNSAGGVVGGSNKFAGKAWIYKHLGGGTQTVDTNLDSAFTEWTTDHKLQGCAYIVVKLQRDDNVFQTGAPQTITALVDGALVYDQRLDSTNGGSGTHRAENPSTWAFSRNPALHAQWFITGGSVVNDQSSRMIKFGLREPYSRVPSAYIVAAANICDETVSGANAPPSGSQLRYRCDGEFSSAENRRDILNAIFESMAGTAVMVHGQWRIYAGAYDSPTHTLTQDDLYGDLEIQDTTPHTERYNAVSGRFVDASKQYIEDTTPFRTDSAYEAQDGGEQITKELDLRAVTDQYQAQRLCEIDLRRSRMMRTVKIPGMLNLLKVAPWETMTFSHARFGWTNRVFRTAERQFNYNEDAARVDLTCRREDAGVYTDMLTADYTTGTSSTDVFQGDGPSSPTGLTITTFPATVRVVVGLPSYLSIGSVIELYEYTSSTPFASATKIMESRSDTFILPYRDTTTRYYWVRVRDARGAVSGTYPASTGQSGAADRIAGTSVTDTPADGSISYTSGTQPRFELTGLNGSVSYTAPSGVAVAVTLSWSAQAQISNTTSGVAAGYANIQAGISVNGSGVYSQDCNLEGCTTASAVWGSLAGSRTITINGGDTIQLSMIVSRVFSNSGSSPAQTITWRAALLDLLPLKG